MEEYIAYAFGWERYFRETWHLELRPKLRLNLDMILVDINKEGVSDIPLVSLDYSGCRAIILSDGEKIGLPHIVLPEDTIDFIRRMKRQLDTTNTINGIIVEADVNYNPNMRECCEDEEIDVVGEYIDRGLDLPLTALHSRKRHIAANPKLQEVYIYRGLECLDILRF